MHHHKRLFIPSLVALVLCQCLNTLQAGTEYVLKSGMELKYVEKMGIWFDGKDGKPDIPKHDDGSIKYEECELTIYVLDKQPQGSYRLLIQRKSLLGDDVLSWTTMFPSGQLNLNLEVNPTHELDSIREVLPLLPKNEDEQLKGWEDFEPRSQVRMRFSHTPTSIKAECMSPIGKLSKGHQTVEYLLDPKTNIPSEVITSRRYDSYKETHSIIVKLKETIQHDNDWVVKFSENTKKYFDASNKHLQFLKYQLDTLAKAERITEGSSRKLLDLELDNLLAAREAITDTIFHKHLDLTIDQFKSDLERTVELAQKWSTVIGSPVPQLKLKDLEGNECSLDKYSGKVVILDFWFRQCSHCIRMMPQVEEVAKTFKQEKSPVLFFGVSVDKEISDAKHVAETLKLSYPVLHSKELAESLSIKGYPTLLVIGPDGTIQNIFRGYSHTLQEDLTKCIRGLLK